MYYYCDDYADVAINLCGHCKGLCDIDIRVLYILNILF